MSRLSDLDERIAATEEKLNSLKAEREAVREGEKKACSGGGQLTPNTGGGS